MAARTGILRARIGWAAGCSAAFVVLYNACNWIASRRAEVGTWYYPWELKIPFLPWMILPYWSLDLFFVGSFFLCRDRRELDTLGRRLLLATVVASAFFVAMPLTTAFPRPEVGGFYGMLFDSLRAFDRPHNLFPSLHIAYRTLLADHYARHARGRLRWVLHAWFSLVGFSTLFTYQHHVVDVLGGFALAVVCFYLVREAAPAPPSRSWPVMGGRYALGAAAALAMVPLAWPWGAWMLWPALGLGLVAAGYLGLGPGIYRKEEGRLALSARLLLAPVLLGHWVSFLHYRRQCRAWDEVVPGLLVGRRLEETEARSTPATAVLDVAAESSEARAFREGPYLSLPVLDLTAPTPDQLDRGVTFIREHRAWGSVYVHCKIGYSRSAAMAGAFLLAEGLATSVDEAVECLRAARPSIVVRPEIREALEGFQQALEARG